MRIFPRVPFIQALSTLTALVVLSAGGARGQVVLFDDTFATPNSYAGLTPSFTANGAEAAGYPAWVDASALGGAAFAHSVALQPGSTVAPNTSIEGVWLTRVFDMPARSLGYTGDLTLHLDFGYVINRSTTPVIPIVYSSYGRVNIDAMTYGDAGVYADGEAASSAFHHTPIDFTLTGFYTLPPGPHTLKFLLGTGYAPGTVTYYLSEVKGTYNTKFVGVPEPGPLALSAAAAGGWLLWAGRRRWPGRSR